MQDVPALPNIAEAKRTLRAAAAEARAAAHAIHAATASARLARAGLDFLGPRRPANLSGFMSFGTEVDVSGLMRRLAGEGWRTALPVIEGKGLPLTFRAWAPGEPTVRGRWDIPRPPDHAEIVEPDVLLVPMLAFDRRGYRLGYGGGFYDRTLARLRAMKPVVAVGVAYAAQEVAEVPRGEFDEPLDWILTEDGARRPCG